MSENGVSAAYVDSVVSSLRSEMHSEIASLRRSTEREIQRLEKEMREVGEMIVGAIDQQTAALVGGVAATTAMIERTRQQIESDFDKTRDKIEIQTESALQIEVGKKVADASALKAKLDAFLGDIKSRFDKSIAGVAINRELYNLNFRKITEEYESKIRKIGEHIFQVKLEDVAPAVRAAEITYEDAHSLPIEMDIKRLSARAENLDDTLELLKASRLDEVTDWLGTLNATLDRYSAGDQLPGKDVALCVEGIAVFSASAMRLLSGMRVAEVGPGVGIDLSSIDDSLQVFTSEKAREKCSIVLATASFQDVDGAQVMALSKAASALRERNLISGDAKAMFEDFLGSGNLKVLV